MDSDKESNYQDVFLDKYTFRPNNFSPLMTCVVFVVLFLMSFVFSITTSRVILLIPFNDYGNSTDNVTSDFLITMFVSLGIVHLFAFGSFIIFFLDFSHQGRWYRRYNLFSSTILLSLFNLISFSVLYDIVNIILFSTKLFGSSAFNKELYEHSKFISFVTGNYIPFSYRFIGVGFILICTIALNVYSIIKGHLLVYRRYTITSPKITKEFTFVHISDIHIGSRFVSHAKKVVEKVLAVRPDFVVITGDLTDSPNIEINELLPFKKLTEICPVYMSTGNHDYFVGIQRLGSMLDDVGVNIISNNVVTLKELNCTVTGTDDANSAKEYMEEIEEAMSKVSSDTFNDKFNIVLQHRPHGYEEVCNTKKFDLMLSGHTHQGQFAPFSLLVYVFFRKAAGFYNIQTKTNKMILYTHPGTGAWSAHMRSAGSNAVTIFEVKPE